MKPTVIFTGFAAMLVGLSVTTSAQAGVVVGPLPTGTMCPTGSMAETKGRAVYCSFYDQNVIEAGIGPCASNVPANMKMQSTVGRNTWCVISKPQQPQNKNTSTPAKAPSGVAIQECVMPKTKATSKGLEVLGTSIYQAPDGQKLKVMKDAYPFWALEKSGKWRKLVANENSGPYKPETVVGWAQEFELDQQELRNCN
jgi:hypothetical protein